MKTLMMTAAAIAFATPMMAQDAATTAPADDTMPAETMPAETAPAGEMGTTADPMATPADPMAAPADGTAMNNDMAHGGITSAPLTAENRGMTASWLQGRDIYTTNEPSTTEWTDVTGDTVPDTWNSIATVSDIVMSNEGEVMGYIADIGGFLGMGTHTVLLDREDLHMAQFGDDVVIATNYTQEELEAMPEFDTDMVRD